MDEEQDAATAAVEDSESYTFDDAVKALTDGQDDPEGDEPEDSEEVDAAEADDQSEEPEAESDDGDDVVFELPDGGEISLKEIKELRDSGLRLQDYTRKTQEIAAQRAEVERARETLAQQDEYVTAATQTLVDFVKTLIPAPPPASLAQANPGEYTRLKAARESAIEELGQILDGVQGTSSKRQSLTEAQARQAFEAENAKLVKAMPHLSDPARLAAFDKAVRDAAVQFGFSEAEVAQTADARIRQMVHYAAIGKKAMENRQAAARRVETPKSGKARPAVHSGEGEKLASARKRFRQTGSFSDAVKLMALSED